MDSPENQRRDSNAASLSCQWADREHKGLNWGFEQAFAPVRHACEAGIATTPGKQVGLREMVGPNGFEPSTSSVCQFAKRTGRLTQSENERHRRAVFMRISRTYAALCLSANDTA